MVTLSVILHYKCALFRDEGQFVDVRLKVDEDFFSVHRIVLAVSSNYFYAMFTNGVKESNQEIIELKDESITSNALKIILEFVLENVVIVAGINELKSHTANTRMCTKWHRVKWSPCIKRSVYANMKSGHRMSIGGFHRKKETQTEREANDKVPLLPPPPLPIPPHLSVSFPFADL